MLSKAFLLDEINKEHDYIQNMIYSISEELNELSLREKNTDDIEELSLIKNEVELCHQKVCHLNNRTDLLKSKKRLFKEIFKTQI